MRNPENEKLRDLTSREVVIVVALIVAALWIAIYPEPLVEILEQPVNQIVQIVQTSPKAGK